MSSKFIKKDKKISILIIVIISALAIVTSVLETCKKTSLIKKEFIKFKNTIK